MITEVHMDDVTSYKNISKLIPTNKISLIYGLNGAGKSTISNFFYDPKSEQYSKCKITQNTDNEILVYNQNFLSDYFYEEDNLKGIFTLSKQNKSVLQQIDQEKRNLETLEKGKTSIESKLEGIKNKLSQEKERATNTIWKIKTNYAGGDRVLEYCLEGLKRTEKLFTHINSIVLPLTKPEYSIQQLKTELTTIQGDKALRINKFNPLSFSGSVIEQNDIFEKIIVGSQEGSVAEFINKVGNSDWVKTGLEYLPENISETSVSCPFCQEDTVTQSLISSIKGVFDESYENDISLLKDLKQKYVEAGAGLNFSDIDELLVINSSISENWKLAAEEVKSNHRENVLLIDSKLKSPSAKITLKQSDSAVSKINNLVKEINTTVDQHNSKLDNKSKSLKEIKDRFWELMRWEYDQTLSAYSTEEKRMMSEETLISSDLTNKLKEVEGANNNISELRKQTVNIEEAVENINNALTDIGVVGFSVIKYNDNLYRVAREDAESDAFHSLSEGEKTVISFLYFIELCKGEKTASTSPKKKVIVIDDPISSLSHLYVFNIGQLIKKTFFNSPTCEQVFVLTHSLYFFYELTHTNKEKRKETQNLFRIIKNCNGSSIVSMKYEEIQNDYQTYWSMIKDDSTPPALIANCMRNIIEYFFNFVQKKDFNNVFQNTALSTDKFNTFYRYMNRESHSLGQNIFDIKEFDYGAFKEGLKLIFEECGYAEHYKAMMK